jgi:hypothetical protein
MMTATNRLFSFLTAAFALILTGQGCANQAEAPQTFLGQTTPGLEPVRFMPEVISKTTRPHSALCFAPDGRAIYWSGYVIGEGRDEWMFVSRLENDTWSQPEKLTINGGRGNGPHLAANGNRLYFGAKRPLDENGPEFWCIWYADKTETGWGELHPVESTLDSTGFSGRPSLTAGGDLYFIARGTRSEMPAVFACAQTEGVFGEPVIAPGAFEGEVAVDPWISPDGRTLLLTFEEMMSQRPGRGSSDLFVTQMGDDGRWGEPVNLGDAVNTPHFDRSPSLSPDGKYLFFIRAEGEMFVESDAHYYWVDAEILDSLRP